MLINGLGIQMAMPLLGVSSLVSLLLSFLLKSPQWFLDEQKERDKAESIDKGESQHSWLLDQPDCQIQSIKMFLLFEIEYSSPAVEEQELMDSLDTTETSTTGESSHYMVSGKFIMDVICVIVIYKANNTFLMLAFDHARDQGAL